MPVAYTGSTTIAGGALVLGAFDVLASSSVVMNTVGSTLGFGNTNNATIGGLSGNVALSLVNDAVQGVALTINTSNTTNLTYSGDLSGVGGSLVKTGNGQLTLSGTNTYTGGTSVNLGTLIFGTAASVGGTGRTVNVSNGASVAAAYGVDNGFLNRLVENSNTFTVALSGDSASNLDFNTSAGANLPGASLGAIGNVTYTGTITPNGGNYRLGGAGGTLNLPNTNALTGANSLTVVANGVVALTGANDYAGGTFLNGGSLRFSALANLGSGALNFNGGALQWAANTTTDVSPATINFGALGGVFDTNGNNVVLASGFGNNSVGGLEKRGGGTLTLAGANTYAGGTTMTGGTVSFTTLANLGTGSITLNGGTVNWLGTEDISTRTVTAQGGNSTLNINSGVVTFANSIGNSGAGRIIKAGAGTLNLNGANTNTGGYTLSVGNLGLGNPDALGTGGLIIDGGILANSSGANLTLNLISSVTINQNFSYAGPNNLVLQADNVTAVGARVLTVTTANTSLTIGGNYATTAGTSKGGAGILAFNGSNVSLAGGLTMGNNTGAIQLLGGNMTVGTSATFSAGSAFTMLGGNATFSLGNNTLNLSNNGDSATLRVDAGANLMVVGGMSIGRTRATGTPNFGQGFIINGGTATIGGNLNIGTSNSAAEATLNSGNFTINGPLVIGSGGAVANDRISGFRVQAGNFVSTDTTFGVLINNNYGGTLALFNGGNSTMEKITFGTSSTNTTAAANLTINGGNVFVGSGGLAFGATPGNLNTNILLTNGRLGAKADWSTNLNGMVGVGFVFHAADAADVPHNITWSGSLVGAGGLNKTGNGVLTLGGNNLYSGPTVINAGTVVVTSLSNGGNATTFSGNLVANNSTVVVANTTGLTVGQMVYGNNVVPGSTITAINPGNIVLSTPAVANGNGTVFTYGVPSSLGLSDATAASLILNGGVMRYAGSATSNARDFTLGIAGGGWESSGSGPLNLSRTEAITLAGTDTARTFRLGGTNTGNNVFAGAITDNGAGATSLLKTGSGRWSLTGANTYSGSTTVDGGVLHFASNLPNSAVTVNTGGTVTGTAVLGGAMTLNSGGSLFAGDSGLGNTTVAALTVNTGAIVNFGLGVGGSTVAVTNLDGLTIEALQGGNGGFNLYVAGTTNPWTSLGIFDLFMFSGNLGGAGVAGLDYTTILNPFSGLDYQFSIFNGNTLRLTVGVATQPNAWNVDADGTWSTTANWGTGTASGGPNAAGLAVTFPGVITAPRTVTLNANRTVGSLSFTSTVSYTLAASGGSVLTLNNSGSPAVISSVAGTHTISAPLALTADGLSAAPASDSNLVISGPISGAAAGLTMAGNGALVLAGTNTYGGGTNFNSGHVEFTTLSNLGSGGLNFNGGALRWAPGSTVDISTRVVTLDTNGGILNTNGNNVTLANELGNGGIGSLTKTGNGVLTLSGPNTFTGAMNMNGGTVSFATLENLGAGTVIGFNGGALRWLPGSSVDISERTVTFNSGGATFDLGANEVLIFSPIGNGGPGGLTKSGTGNLTLLVANTYGGATRLDEGRLVISSDGSLGTVPAVATPNHLVLENNTIFGTTGSTVSLVANRGVAIGPSAGAGSATVDVPDGTLTIAGIITNNGAGTGQLTKAGNGMLTLSGANTFSGGVMLNSGTIATAANGALGLGTLFFNGGNLDVSLGGTSPGAIAFLTNGTILNSSANISTVGGTLASNSTTVLTLSNSGPIALAGDMSNFNGTVQLTTGALRFNGNDSSVNTGSSTATFDFGTSGSLVSRNAGTINLGTIISNNTTTTISGPAVGTGTAMFSIGGGNAPSVFAGSIVNAGNNALAGINKVGTSTLTLTGANTYTGGTTVANGTLDIGGGGPTGTIGGTAGNVTVNSTGTLNFNRSNTYTVANVINGDGGVNHVGTGELVLTGNNAYTGATTISGGGVLAVTSLTNGALQLSSTTTAPVTLASNTTGPFARTSETTNASATVNLGVGNTSSLFAGQTVSGAGIPGNTTILSVDHVAGTIQLSANATATSTTANLTYGGNPVVMVSNTAGLLVGQQVFGAGIPANATIAAIDAGNNTVTLTGLATANTTGSNVTYTYPMVTVPSTLGLSVNQTVAGPGIPLNSTIASIDAANNTITLNVGATATGTNNINYITRNPLGGSTSAPANLVIANGTFRYNGTTAASTDRGFTIGTNATLEASGATPSATATFANTSAIGLSGTNTPRTFTLAGSNTGDNILAGLLGDNGSGATSLVKSGAGTWVLTNANTYTGGTSINAGVLKVTNTSGSATGAGAVTVAGGATLAGTGIIAGVVSTQANSTVVPGQSIGTLTVGGLNIATGSNFTYEFSTDGATHDLIVVTNNGGLVTNPLTGGAGGGFNLYVDGTTNPFAIQGTYNLFGITGTIGGSGVGAFTAASILNPQFGVTYNFDVSGGFVRLIITPSGASNVWNLNGDGNWGTLANWSPATPSVPDGVGALAYFGAVITSARTVTLDGGRTVGNLTFDNVSSYTLAPGAGALTLNNGGSAAVVNVIMGNHVISAPVVLTANGLAANIATNTSLEISGTVTGPGSVTKTGNGLLALSATNNYAGGTTVSAGILRAGVLANGGQDSSIGNSSNAASNLVLNGGILSYGGSGSTTDRLATIGTAGGGFGNDATGPGGFTSTGSLVLAGTDLARTVTFAGNGTGPGSFAPVIGDNGIGATAVHKTGTSTWELTANNTYTGITTVSNGVLGVTKLVNGGAPSGLGASTADAANLVLNGGTVSFNGPGAATTDRLFTLGTAGGGLAAGSGSSVTWGNIGTLVFSAPDFSTTLSLSGAGNGTFTPIIPNNGAGNVSVVKNGPGLWTIGNANTYSGGTTLNAGILELGNAAALGTGALTFDAGTLRAQSAVVTAVTNAIVLASANPVIAVDSGNTFSLSGVMSGNGGFTKTGDGTLALGGANTFTGGMTLDGGTIALNAGAAAGSGGTVILNTGTILVGISDVLNGNNLVVNGTATILKTGGGTTTFNMGSGATITGNGTLNLNNAAVAAASFLTLNNNMTAFAGTVVLQGNGNIRLNSGGASTNNGSPAATWNLGENGVLTSRNPGTVSLGALIGGSAASLGAPQNSTGNLIWSVGALGIDTTYAGTILLGNGGNTIASLTKVGNARLYLTNPALPYVGATIVNAGTLVNNGNITASATTVNTGGTIAGTGGFAAVTVNGGGRVSPAESAIGTLTATNLTWNTDDINASALWTLSNVGNTSDLLHLTGILTKGTGTVFLFDFQGTGFFPGSPNTYTLIDFVSNSGFVASDFNYVNAGPSGTYQGFFTVNPTNIQFTVTAVPEPGTWALLLGGATLLVVVARKRRRAAAVRAPQTPSA